MTKIHIVLPHQLFQDTAFIEKNASVFLLEERLFFRQYAFHKQKIAFHRASMKKYESYLSEQGFSTRYISSTSDMSDIRLFLKKVMSKEACEFTLFDPTDDWVERRIAKVLENSNSVIRYLTSPMWLNDRQALSGFFKTSKKKFFQTTFYKSERKRLGLLLEKGEQPLGGKWTFDDENRKKYPKEKIPPAYPELESDPYYDEAISYVEKYFSNNPGKLPEKPLYPTDYVSTEKFFKLFLKERFSEFGDYEDAILKDQGTLNHSVLTPMMNVGLITPNQVVEASMKYAKNNSVPLNALEGFIRQITGWREFIRGVYIAKGREERTTNFWGFKRKIPVSFYDGTTGIEPVDNAIHKVLDTSYNHHIERLMVIGNFMFLCEFDPDEVYKWFMEMYIDSYDWVMVPNVYGMSQFADGGLMSTKPYFSGSNYLMKMSDFKKGNWQSVWDGMFWRFIALNREFFLTNPRLSMMVRTWDKMDNDKKQQHLNQADEFLNQL